MKIAILGSRGLPLDDLSFGGFEAFIAGLAPRLASRGHEVTVYCRRNLYHRRPPIFVGVRLRYIPSVESKALGTPIHMSLSMVDALFRDFDAVLVVNPGNGLQCVLLRIATRARIALNMDGVEWRRGKWGLLARSYFKFASRMGARFVHAPILDSRAMMDIYRSEFGVEGTYIPYAVEVYSDDRADLVQAAGLSPGSYGLIVARLVPENQADLLIEGFQSRLPGSPLVVVGTANYRSAFHERLKRIAGPQVRFLGHVHDQRLLWELFRRCRVYLHGHSVGGTNPSLLQGLAAGCLIGAYDVVFNREVMADCGWYFHRTVESLGQVARELWYLPPDEKARLQQKASNRIREGGYGWDDVVDAYEAVLAGRR